MLPLSYQYFLSAAEEMNFTRAAQRLHITQQTLSQGIAKLEEQYGVKLFERRPHLTLTFAGERLQAEVRKMLVLDLQINKEMQDFRSEEKSRLNIGIGMLRGQALLPELLQRYAVHRPQCEIHLVEKSSAELMDDLLTGKTDLMIHKSEVDSHKCRSIRILSEQIVLVARDELLREYCLDHYEEIIHSADSRLPFPLTYLRNCPFLMPDHSTNLYRQLASHLESFSPRAIVTSKNHATLYRLASLGVGITFSIDTQTSWLHESYKAQESSLHIIPYRGFGESQIIYISYPKNYYISNAAKEFIRLALQFYHMDFEPDC